MRSWKYLTTAVSVLGIEIASDLPRPSEVRPKGTIVLRAVDRDPVLMVGTERTLIRTDGVAVFPLGDRRREIHSRTP
jgi:hypothetical protein